jgi:hypothetical protein
VRLLSVVAGSSANACMTGIQDDSIQIRGNPALVIWFQGLTKYLKPKKAKSAAKV